MRVVLGFDSSCSTCARISRSITEEVGDLIEAVPLTSPEMETWRRDEFGADAPWAPTLVRSEGGRTKVSVGWRIAPALARHLGVTRTWRILALLGRDALDQRHTAPSFVSRSTFIRAGLGSFVGLTVLAKSGTATAGTASAESPVKVEVLHGEELIAAAREGLATGDVANVAEPRSLVTAAAGPPASVMDIDGSHLRESSENTGVEPPPDGELEVYGARVTHQDGVVETGLMYYQHDQRTLLHTRFLSREVNGLNTMTHRLHVDHEAGDEGPKLTTVAWSFNGAEPWEVPDTDGDTLSSDPCGPCTGPPGNPSGGRLQQACNWEATWQCMLSAGECGLCAASCTGGWFACTACMVTNCVGAYNDCCTSTTPVCGPCGLPT
ncbi:hypothetical protein [Nocardiopsis sp. MG754419]|uniref:hypothetical protein n=1 Tax=Nocardiopsis sp. MG754419 TaxID=2259865 RepID=UPI001BABCBA3|nr:hypothetical protein [Nocardiopsis sp. MG754419]